MCFSLVKLIDISGPSFPHLGIWVIIVLPQRLIGKIECESTDKELSTVLAHCKLSGQSDPLKNVKCLPNASLTEPKIFLNFQAFPKQDPAVNITIFTLLLARNMSPVLISWMISHSTCLRPMSAFFLMLSHLGLSHSVPSAFLQPQLLSFP